MSALRYNQGKIQWSLVHFDSISELPKVLEFGAQKYSRDNWKKGLKLNEILDSMQRHLSSVIDGEQFDDESNLHHMGHIMCNAMFYMYNYKKQTNEQKKEEKIPIKNQPLSQNADEFITRKNGANNVNRTDEYYPSK